MSHETKGMLVVGPVTGNGLAIARAASADGYRVAVCGPGPSDASAGESPGAAFDLGEARIQWLSAPLATETGIETALAEALDRLGPCHVVVCDTTADAAADTPLADMDVADWRARIEARLTTPYVVARHVIWELMGQGMGAQILLVTPDDGPGATGAATVTGIEGLTRSIAREYGARGLRCNAIAVRRGADGDGADERVAAAARFLWSAEAAYVDGTLIKLG